MFRKAVKTSSGPAVSGAAGTHKLPIRNRCAGRPCRQNCIVGSARNGSRASFPDRLLAFAVAAFARTCLARYLLLPGCNGRRFCNGLIEVGCQIFDGFEPDRQADQITRDP